MNKASHASGLGAGMSCADHKRRHMEELGHELALLSLSNCALQSQRAMESWDDRPTKMSSSLFWSHLCPQQ